MRLIILILILFKPIHFYAQGSLSLIFLEKHSLKADRFIGVDDFGFTYFLKDNALFKASKQDTLSYSNYSLGKITTVNLHNPFKIVVFYKDFNAAIILDSKLNALTDVIEFTQETQFNNAEFLSYSSENNLWIYADDNKLHLYNFQSRKDHLQTQPISFYDSNFKPTGLTSNYTSVWVYDLEKIYEFNQYGNFIKTITTPIKDLKYIASYRKGLLLLNNEFLCYKSELYNLKTVLKLPNIINGIYLHTSKLYVFNENQELLVFDIKLED